MNTNQHEQEAHEMIDHIFQETGTDQAQSRDARGHVGRQDRPV